MVYGIDERFGSFHGVDGLTLDGREAFISEALASELGAKAGDGITLRVAKPDRHSAVVAARPPRSHRRSASA